ncbi:MAG: hypothetical protein WAS21_28145 [Geminicoccaceae bacterium]
MRCGRIEPSIAVAHVGDLDRLWQGPGGSEGIPASAITSQDGNLRLTCELGPFRRGLAVGSRAIVLRYFRLEMIVPPCWLGAMFYTSKADIPRK